MNCKKGDMAMLIPPAVEAGTIVTCVKFAGNVCDDYHPDGLISWEIEPGLENEDNEIVHICADSWLMPITPPDDMKELEKELLMETI